MANPTESYTSSLISLQEALDKLLATPAAITAEAVVAAADFGAETALKQFDVIIEGTAEALQTLIFGGFEENFLCCYL